MSTFVNSIKDVSKNYARYDKWEQEQADKNAKKKVLAEKYPCPQEELDIKNEKARTIIRATEIMDNRSENNCESMEMATAAVLMTPAIAVTLLQQPLTLKAVKGKTKKINNKIDEKYQELQKLASNDKRHEELTQEIKVLKDKIKHVNSKYPMYGSYISIGLMLASLIAGILWANSKQKEASRIGRFQAKRDELSDEKNFVIYTDEQKEKCNEIAKDIIIPNEKNNIVQNFKDVKNITRDKKAYLDWKKTKDPNELEKLKNKDLTYSEINSANEDKELITEVVKNINIKAEEYSENLENSYNTLEVVSFLIAVPLGIAINKILSLCKVPSKYSRIVSFLTPIITTLGISIYGTSAQKQAAQVGRYKARKEMLENPERFLYYSENEYETVKDIKAPTKKQGFFKRLGNSFKFLFKYGKEKKEYKNYKEKEQKQNEKLYKAYNEIEITDKQRKDAKNLQTHVFRAFDEVDEMSQRYSEDIEAGTEIAMQVVSNAWTLGSTIALAGIGVGIAKGKISLAKLAKKLSNLLFKKESKLRLSIDKFVSALEKSGKNETAKFQKALLAGKLSKYFERLDNKEIKDASEDLVKEVTKMGADAMEEVGNGTNQQAKNFFKTMLDKHLKQSKIAKWGRNIISQAGKLIIKNKLVKKGVKLTEEQLKTLGMDFNYQNYKTLINTALIGASPILILVLSVPYAFNAWLTDIQKKAGKIGVMKAIENIDNPKYFADEV